MSEHLRASAPDGASERGLRPGDDGAINKAMAEQRAIAAADAVAVAKEKADAKATAEGAERGIARALDGL